MITASSSMLQAFQTAAGVSAGQLNLFIRTLVLAGTYCWAVWVLYGFMNEYRHHGVDDFIAEIKRVSRVLLVVTLITILVFVH